jgi:glycosyltransferase involved in cell wall biosynthesis
VKPIVRLFIFAVSRKPGRTLTMISVVIPTHNSRDFISRALRSVFVQTRLPSEIVVVDDCSTDDTAEIVKATARESPVPVEFIALTRNSGGPAKPFNAGIEAARGDVNVLLEHDDLMKPRRIETQVRALSDRPDCSIVIGRFSILGYPEDDLSPMWPVSQLHDLADHLKEGAEYSVVDSRHAFKPLLTRNYSGSLSNFCFSKQWWRRIGKIDESVRTCCDLDFMLRATMAGPIAIVNEIITEYRFSGDSLHRTDPRSSLLEAELVRLRAATQRPAWAGNDIDVLRFSVLSLAKAMIKEGHLGAMRAIIETLTRHKGFLVMTNRS